MSDILFKLNKPITLKEGTGVTLTNNGITGTQVIDGTNDSIVRVSIGQDVATGSNVQFNDVTLAPNTMTIGTGNTQLIFSDGAIDGDLHFGQNLLITENLTVIGPFTYKGNFTSSTFTFDSSSVSTTLNTGNTIFGDNINTDKQFFSSSMEITGSYKLNNYLQDITEISNDTTAVDEKTTSLVTEYAAYQFLQNLKPDRDYLRKSFVHTGSFVNSTTTRFSVVTASAPSNLTSTTENDFMFFVNGMLMENDALTIQQNSNNLDLTIDSDSLGYTFSSNDEVIGFGKFNS
jgi:hypothetical protein